MGEKTRTSLDVAEFALAIQKASESGGAQARQHAELLFANITALHGILAQKDAVIAGMHGNLQTAALHLVEGKVLEAQKDLALAELKGKEAFYGKVLDLAQQIAPEIKGLLPGYRPTLTDANASSDEAIFLRVVSKAMTDPEIMTPLQRVAGSDWAAFVRHAVAMASKPETKTTSPIESVLV